MKILLRNAVISIEVKLNPINFKPNLTSHVFETPCRTTISFEEGQNAMLQGAGQGDRFDLIKIVSRKVSVA